MTYCLFLLTISTNGWAGIEDFTPTGHIDAPEEINLPAGPGSMNQGANEANSTSYYLLTFRTPDRSASSPDNDDNEERECSVLIDVSPSHQETECNEHPDEPCNCRSLQAECASDKHEDQDFGKYAQDGGRAGFNHYMSEGSLSMHSLATDRVTIIRQPNPASGAQNYQLEAINLPGDRNSGEILQVRTEDDIRVLIMISRLLRNRLRLHSSDPTETIVQVSLANSMATFLGCYCFWWSFCDLLPYFCAATKLWTNLVAGFCNYCDSSSFGYAYLGAGLAAYFGTAMFVQNRRLTISFTHSQIAGDEAEPERVLAEDLQEHLRKIFDNIEHHSITWRLVSLQTQRTGYASQFETRLTLDLLIPFLKKDTSEEQVLDRLRLSGLKANNKVKLRIRWNASEPSRIHICGLTLCKVCNLAMRTLANYPR